MVEPPMRVALVLFGVIPRSIRWTWPVFERQLLEPLRARGHVVDIYGFNVEVHSPVVDDMPLNQSDVALVPFAALDSWRQEDIDSVIARLCPDGVLKCKSFDDQASEDDGTKRLLLLASAGPDGLPAGLTIPNPPPQEAFRLKIFFARCARDQVLRLV